MNLNGLLSFPYQENLLKTIIPFSFSPGKHINIFHFLRNQCNLWWMWHNHQICINWFSAVQRCGPQTWCLNSRMILIIQWKLWVLHDLEHFCQNGDLYVAYINISGNGKNSNTNIYLVHWKLKHYDIEN